MQSNKRAVNAFTIVEMLVVLSIMITMMGLGIGAWVNSAETNQTLATQQLITGLLQQARNRSISEEEPVVIHILKDSATIVGLHKHYLMHVPKPRVVGTPTTVTPRIPAVHRKLFRDENAGFAIRCQVNAPPANANAPYVIPLVLITELGNANQAHVDDAIAGIEIWRVPQFVFHDTASPKQQKVSDTWTVIGWLGTRPAHPSETLDLSSPTEAAKLDRFSTYAFLKDATDFVREASFDGVTHADGSSGLDENRYALKPFAGDQWQDIEMIFDDTNLYLFRNNQRVDFLENTGYTPDLDQEIEIYTAIHRKNTVAATDVDYIADADIDDAAVLQIGSGDEEYFPGSIRPFDDYKIICENGIIKCFDSGDNEISTMVFVNDDELEAKNFEVSFGSDGTIINNKVYSREEITAAPPPTP